MKSLVGKLNNSVIYLDGAIGTSFQRKNLDSLIIEVVFLKTILQFKG